MTPWRSFIVALVLPLLFTALVLFDVLRNRAAAREPVVLTEREMSLSSGSDENSGMTAWIVWAEDPEARDGWITPATLRSLGFDAPDGLSPLRPADVRQLQRRAYVALELRERQPTRSRLVPVEASSDRAALLAKYPNGRTHVVTAGFIGLRPVPETSRRASVEGYLVSLDPRGIHVPEPFATMLRRRSARDRRFTLSVRYGSQLEPWITDAH
jgi:hypothetical protein